MRILLTNQLALVTSTLAWHEERALSVCVDWSCRLDREGKGYVHTSDWGNVELRKLVELFSLAYMQRFLGLPGPTSRPDEVSVLA